ncbi:MAG: orotidine-5'-phosphate decarboxylase [Deinococcota bacterium]
MPGFFEKLHARIEITNSLLCLGLDPDPSSYPNHFPNFADNPEDALVTWSTGILQVLPEVACVKPNIAFYEQFGVAGLRALARILEQLPADIPVLLDAKRGDIGNTAKAYAKAAFEDLNVDAITVNSYLGEDAITPFLEYPGKAVFVLCHTSNPSAAQIQHHGEPAEMLFEHVAQQASKWGNPEQLGFVVGATQPEALTRVRELAPEHWFLAPGVGAQGGQVERALQAGLFQIGQVDKGMIVPVSRGILYADDSLQAARELNSSITAIRTTRTVSPTPSHKTENKAIKSHDDLIRGLIEVEAIQFGEFTLASGQTSPIYIDLRRLVASPKLLHLTAQAYAQHINPNKADLVAGVPYGALPIGTAVSLVANLPLVYPRKEVKTHGTKQQVEGKYEAGQHVSVIEDLVTSGGSVLHACEQLEAEGLIISNVIVLIDREQGGRDNLEQAGYTLNAVFTITDVLDSLLHQNLMSQADYDSVTSYLAQKG